MNSQRTDRRQGRTISRCAWLRGAGTGALALAIGRRAMAAAAEGTSVIAFEETLAAMRTRHYRDRTVDIVNTGFRPVGGKVADFAVAQRDGRYHFFYIERRLQEGTPFYPGHEIYFGHASTADFVHWRVHEPVMLIRPGTWEEAHVWAPCILRRGSQYVMAYTGVNRHLSQDIGLASSTDLFQWKRWTPTPSRRARTSRGPIGERMPSPVAATRACWSTTGAIG